jgi:hypothetical protein
LNKFLFLFLFNIVLTLMMVSAQFGFDDNTKPRISSTQVVVSSGGSGDSITNNYYNGSSYNETYATWAYNQTSTSSPTSSITDDVGFEISKGWVLFDGFNPTLAIETGEVGQLGWGYAGTVTLGTAYLGNRPGTVKVSTGTGANTNSSLNLGGGANWIIDSKSGNITVVYALNISHPPVMTNNYTAYIGLHDAVAATAIPVDGVFFLINTTLQNLTCASFSNNAKTYNVTNYNINGSWLKLQIDILNVSGVYQKRFYIDNKLVCVQGATNTPMGTARAFGTGVTLKKYGGTTARTIDVDYFYYKQEFAEQRL